MGQPHASLTPATEQPILFRRICSWCRDDLGALWEGSQHHSYAICPTCQRIYFPALYELDMKTTKVAEHH